MSKKISFVSLDKDLPAYRIAKEYPDFRVAFIHDEEFFHSMGKFSIPGNVFDKPIYFYFGKEDQGLIVYASLEVLKLIRHYDDMREKEAEREKDNSCEPTPHIS